MADNNQENIKPEFNNGTLGLNTDQTLNQVKQGVLTYALNASVENFDASSVNYQNEQGNEFCLSFPESYVLIGRHFIPEKNKHIFFLVNPKENEYASEIGYMDNNDCIYHTLVSSTCLNFQITNPIHKIVHRITNCSIELYWTDGLNPRRYLDINNIPWKLQSGSILCDPIYDVGNLDCNQLKLQPNFEIPKIGINEKLRNGGNLKAGVYQFAAQYSDAFGNGYTSFYSVTNPLPVADTQTTSQAFDYPVGKSIDVNISNLDLTGQFQYFNLAVIKTVNQITSVELIGTYFINANSQTITYTGQIVDNIRLSINDIFEKFPYYGVADDVTAVQDVIVWKGLVTEERVNYQNIANNITLYWETYKIPNDENYAEELNALNLRGYLRDEVYAFEIMFLLKNGKETDSFHIPGRAPESSDLTLITNSNPDYIEEGTSAERWKIYNTASVIGNSTSPKIGNATAHQYGKFSYWQSTEKYPCNSDIWGNLSDTFIRHHKFPDVYVSPLIDTKIFTGVDNLSMGDVSVYPIGVRANIDQIKALIAASSLTTEQKEEIVGFKIIRGDRSTNKSIVAKGMLRNVNKYTKEDQEYYYPNYPYNDLSTDSFLNATNNAWSALSEPFRITVYSLPQSDSDGPYIEYQLTDPNTNKIKTLKHRSLGYFDVCSLTKPVVTSPGIKNKIYYTDDNPYPVISSDNIATVNYRNYDLWRLRSINPSFGDCCGGWRAEWPDYMSDDIGSVYVNGCLSGKTRTRYVYVRADVEPSCVQYCSRCGRRSNLVTPYRVPAEECGTTAPLPSLLSNTALADKQIFNSPETSFGQPFVSKGNILKLETVMFGAGKAHFVEVKNNAKYKLLTKEAQEDALEASRKLGAITSNFNASAMFAAYQSYLTIYINGITRKNYAYSFNSIADYNYNMAIPNTGSKQRVLDVAKYLIPGVQTTSPGDAPINNYQRESSVYLKTTGTNLPYPSYSPLMLSGSNPIIEDYSRFTISDIDNCSTPAKEEPVRVVSYYASIKNKFDNQWGQIYSYKTVDTGTQINFITGVQGNTTIFGGDTFINRFAFKTKLPFFIDNRVGAPDDSDIFYDEIGNIGYPKYWHSSRSILKDFTGTGVGTLSSIISYKAHNFDCPNSQSPGPDSVPPVTAEQNPNRTYYDGYFYLFAYGVPYFYCESSYNVDLRQAFNNKEGDFWPHVNNSIPDDWVQESFVSINNDNTYYYNTTFSKQNKENVFTHLPVDFDSASTCYTYYPFRAIYSEPQYTNADNRINNWLIYKANSYFDFPQNYGNLVSLDGIQNKAILARFENKSLLYNNLLTIDTSNPQAAYVGNPNLFKGAPPIDFAETDLGYVGSQHKFLLKIPQGQITIDAKRGQVFLISGTQSVDLSAFGSGMNRFFTDHLSFEILRYFPNVNIDNHYNGVGLHGVYDSKFDRVILTKLDYIPLLEEIQFDGELNQFYIETESGRTQVYLTDADFFCNKSWTISYNFNIKSWVSFHTYLPNYYIAENNFFYSGLNECCNEFDFVVGPIVGNTTSTTTTSTTLNCNITGVSALPNCNIVASAYIIVSTTSTTTSTSSTTTTTTTTFVPLPCINLLLETSSLDIEFIEYKDCDYISHILEMGGSTGITSTNICVTTIIDVSENINVTEMENCTTTTTTTILL